MNLARNLEAIAAAHPDRECIVGATRRATYGQVADRARRFASVLHAHGLGCRRERDALAGHESGQDHLGIYLLNCPEYLEAMLGAYRARVAPFNVNYRYVDDELVYLLADADTAALVYHARWAPTLARIRSRVPAIRLWLQVADESGEALLPGALDFEAALAGADPAGPPVVPSPDDLYLLYTGGTTGAPKGVLWRQEDIYHAAMSGRVPGGPCPTTVEELVAEAVSGFVRMMPAPPLMHGAAQWLAFAAFHQGGTVVLAGRPERLDPADVWGTAEREGVNMLAIVGDAFARPLVDELARRKYDLSRLFIVGSGGAVLSPHLKQAFLVHLPHATVIDAFGASETGAQGTFASRDGAPVQTGAFAMSDRTVVLSDDLARVVAPGADETGWLAQAGHVPLGYYKDAAKTARTFPAVGGRRFAVPGDHARVRSDGAILVLGRGSICINSGGEKIYPEEVEQVLRRHPAVYDAVVVGTPDERFGEQVTAVVQARPATETTHDELVSFAGKHLARYKLPKTTVFVDEMTRSPSGKPDYRWARATALAARGLPAGG
jgi:acyl-CoA synthetase (AMP-forming)/AMP-acid ligase II